MNALDRAADRLRGRWHQGGYNDANGNVCIIAACDLVGATWPEKLTVYAVLREDTGIPSVVDFNDDPATSEEDVLLLLKKASARLDRDES